MGGSTSGLARAQRIEAASTRSDLLRQLTPSTASGEQFAPLAGQDAGQSGAQAPAAAPKAGDQPPQHLGVGDTIADNTSSTATLAIGSSLSSSINAPNDLDYIKVSLVAGQTYVFSLEGGTMDDSYLELRNSSNVLLTENDDGGIVRDAFLKFTATTSGDYWIVARGYDGSNTGTYTLSADTLQAGSTSPTPFFNNGKAKFSWDEAAIQITREGASWASAFDTPTIVTYAYRSTAPATMPDDTSGFSRFSAAQIAAAEASLAAWASVANVVFQRVDSGDGYSNNATILFGNYSSGAEGAAAFAYLPLNSIRSSASNEGDVWVNISLTENQDLSLGGYGRHALMHEIGHAIGLEHPGDYNADPDIDIQYNTSAEYFNDSRAFTVMSYFGSTFVGGNLPAFASLPQLHDIAAVQRLYGANLATRAGDTVYGFHSNTGLPEYAIASANEAAVFAIWDGGGLDTLDLSGYSTNSTIDLRQEALSSAGLTETSPGVFQPSIFNISIARGVVIENAIGGSGADTITGNDANNVLTGNAGADILNGGAGNDTLIGGTGDDVYWVSEAGDVVTELADAGNDFIHSTLSLALPANVEGLVLHGFAFAATGNALNNVLSVNSAGDSTAMFQPHRFDGGSGSDNMVGGFADDVYVIDSAGDIVNDPGGHNIAEVYAETWNAPTAVQEVLLLGGARNVIGDSSSIVHGFTIIGNALNNELSGGGGSNRLEGGGGDDILRGFFNSDQLLGGDGRDMLYASAGDDSLTGGAGNDVLHGDNGFDTAHYAAERATYLVLSFGPITAVLTAGSDGLDRLDGVEQLSFSDATVDASTALAFTAYDYLATYPDLLSALGDNAQGGFDHYVDYGFSEGRLRDGFANYDYIASYADLTAAIGDDAEAGARHYVQFGAAEGRLQDAFANYDYLASHPELIASLNADPDAAAQHYVQTGFGAGLARDSFANYDYIASYADLIVSIGDNPEAAARHYVDWGFAEGRAVDLFDNYEYIASNPDLIVALGLDAEAGARHYVQWGFGEGRALDSFDAAQYLANYADLEAAFGDDLLAATIHFIEWGYAEGRTDHPIFG